MRHENRLRLSLGRLGAGWIAFAVSACAPCEYNTFAVTRGELTGSEVVPPVESRFEGQMLHFSASLREGRFAGESVDWHITASLNGEDVISVHLHAGDRGETGPIVLALPNWTDRGEEGFSVRAGRDYRGAIPINELLERMRNGSVYVDVHTTRFPEGELRGQLTLVDFQDRREVYCGLSG